MARRNLILMSVLATAVIAAAVVGRLASADSMTDCMNRMVPCYQYLNSTAKPPASCCNPLKAQEAATIGCLCNLYNTPGMLETYNINVTQVLRVGQGCGVNATTSVCKEGAAQSPPPTGVAGSTGHNGRNRVWTGISWFPLLTCASMMLY